MQIDPPYISIIQEVRHLISPMVSGHLVKLFPINICIISLIAVWERILIIILFHVFDIPLYLRLEQIEAILLLDWLRYS
jgi:hypothetical protein